MYQIRSTYRLSLVLLNISKRTVNPNQQSSYYINNKANSHIFLNINRNLSSIQEPQREDEKNSDVNENRSMFPRLSDFPNIMWPSFIKSLKNWILINFIIRPYFDQEFNLKEFIQGTKYALQVISTYMANSEFSSLNNLVAASVINEVTPIVKNLSISQRGQLAIQEKDIYLTFPYEVGIIYEENQEKVKKWVEVIMIFHVLHGLSEMQKNGIEIPWNIGMAPEYQKKIFVCNYRFRKEFTNGAPSDWIVNAVNHFRPIDVIQKQ